MVSFYNSLNCVLCRLPDEDRFLVICKADAGGREKAAELVRDQLRLTVSEYADQRIRGPQINTDDCHIALPFRYLISESDACMNYNT